MSTEENEEQQALPLSPERQRAAIGYLLTRENFFLRCKDRIKPSWFVDPILQSVYSTLISWYEEHHKFPSAEDVFEHPNIQAESQQRRNLIKTQISVCVHSMSVYAIEPIQAELTTWLHARTFMDGIYKSKELFNRKQFTDAYRALETTNRTIRETTFSQVEEYKFGDIEAIFAKRDSNVEGALTWGLPAFDKLLLPEGGGKGCLLPGASTVLVGSSNAGKTSCMLTVTSANLIRGKKVLVIVHEGSPHELQVKMLCSIAGKSLGWWKEWRYVLTQPELSDKEMEVFNFIKKRQLILDSNLTFMPMIRQGLTVEEVMSAIRLKQDEALSRDGKGFDLVIDDYPALLTSDEAKGGKLEVRHRDSLVYSSFTRIAEECGFHVLSSAQTNREGARVNSGEKGRDKRLLEMTDIAESFGVMQNTATVITINRDSEAEQKGRIVFHCAKSRTGDKGWSVVSKSAFEVGRTHWDNLPCTYYRGSATPSQRMDDFLETYRNQMIPYDIEW